MFSVYTIHQGFTSVCVSAVLTCSIPVSPVQVCLDSASTCTMASTRKETGLSGIASYDTPYPVPIESVFVCIIKFYISCVSGLIFQHCTYAHLYHLIMSQCSELN